MACCLPTCAQGLSAPVMGNSGYGIFGVFWLLFCVLCAWGALALLVSLFPHRTLGSFGVPPAGHVLVALFGGGITFGGTTGGNVRQLIKLLVIFGLGMFFY